MARSSNRAVRSRYARTNADLLVNSPDGMPSGMDPVWWYGNDNFIKPLDPASALSAVTRATSIIVNTLSSLPWRLLSGGPIARQSLVELPPPRWIEDPMLLRPDNRLSLSAVPYGLRLSRSVFWASWIRSALLHGMGYMIYEPNNLGEPIPGTMRILNPSLVSPIYDQSSGATHRRIGDPRTGEYIDTDIDGSFQLGPRLYRMLELLNPVSPVDEYGCAQGVLAMHANELGLATQAISYAGGMYRSGVPAGYLKVSTPNFNAPAAEKLKEQWLNAHGGDRRSTAVLNSTTEYVPIQMSPVDMALIQMRQMSLLDISNMFGVPSFFLGYDGSSSNTYSNAESRNQDLQQSLMHWAKNAEDTVGSLVPLGSFVEIDFRGLLRPDTKSRYEAYASALSSGWITVAEVRQLENLGQMPDELGWPAPDPNLNEDPNKDAGSADSNGGAK